MTRATPLIVLTLLAVGWGGGVSARQSEVEKEVDRTVVALVQAGSGGSGRSADPQRIQIEMPNRVQQKFTAYFVQSSSRRIPIQGSLVGCPRAPLAKNEPIELDSFSWGEPTSRGSSPQATRRPDGDYLVRVAARKPGPCKLELVVPGHLLAPAEMNTDAAALVPPLPAAPGSGSRRAPSRREEGSEAAAVGSRGNPTAPLQPQMGMKARSAETSVYVAQKARAAQAHVPMKHEDCAGRTDCTTHGLVSRMGNLTFAASLTVSCADGQQVTGVRYSLADGPYIAPLSQQLVNAPTGSPVYQHELGLAPYSPQDFEEICREELGGDWADQTAHPDVDREEKALLIATLRVWGRCTGDAADTLADTTTKVQVTCVDTDYP